MLHPYPPQDQRDTPHTGGRDTRPADQSPAIPADRAGGTRPDSPGKSAKVEVSFTSYIFCGARLEKRDLG